MQISKDGGKGAEGSWKVTQEEGAEHMAPRLRWRKPPTDVSSGAGGELSSHPGGGHC